MNSLSENSLNKKSYSEFYLPEINSVYIKIIINYNEYFIMIRTLYLGIRIENNFLGELFRFVSCFCFMVPPKNNALLL